MSRIFFLTSIFFSLALTTTAFAKEKILVVLSGVDYVSLKPPAKRHATGYFLSELTTPLQGILAAGYEVVFANPTGKEPSIDRLSLNPKWFKGKGDSDEEAAEKFRMAKELIASFPGLKEPRHLSSFTEEELETFDGIFLPGGHAPMEDLYKDRDLGRILRHFHKNKKPTSLICHAPVALLSAMDDPDTKLNEPSAFVETLEIIHHLKLKDPENNKERIAELEKDLDQLSSHWPYKEYTLTVFSNAEEQYEEAIGDLEGYLTYYAADALAYAGAEIRHAAHSWKSHVELSDELVTGQNPMSDTAFRDSLLERLTEYRVKNKPVHLWQDFFKGGALAKETLYDASTEKVNWDEGYVTLFIGRRLSEISKEEYLPRLTNHINEVRKVFGPFGLKGYFVYATEDFEIAYQNWKDKESMELAIASEEGAPIIEDVLSFMEMVLFTEASRRPQF